MKKEARIILLCSLAGAIISALSYKYREPISWKTQEIVYGISDKLSRVLALGAKYLSRLPGLYPRGGLPDTIEELEIWNNNRLAELQPYFRRKIIELMNKVESQYGIKLIIFEAYRSPKRQHVLYMRGKNNSPPFYGGHQFGLAVDIYPWKIVNGRLKGIYSYTKEEYTKHGNVALSMGLIWGGTWKGKAAGDYGHVEDKNKEQWMAELKAISKGVYSV